DSDDYLPEKTLFILAKNIKDNNMIRGRIKKTNFSSSMTIVLDGLYTVKTYTSNKFNLIKNKSALNTLIRKDFILEEQLFFSEKAKVYSDLIFIFHALIKTEKIPYIKYAIYFKIKRNDPVTNPSLIQLDRSVKTESFLYIYNDLKDRYGDRDANLFLDKQLLNFYRQNI